jgi:hypothetical protein
MRESENLNQFVVVLSILFWLILSGVFATDFFTDIFYLLFFVVADSAFACRFKSIGIASLHCCCFRCRCGGFAAGRIRRRFDVDGAGWGGFGVFSSTVSSGSITTIVLFLQRDRWW